MTQKRTRYPDLPNKNFVGDHNHSSHDKNNHPRARYLYDGFSPNVSWLHVWRCQLVNDKSKHMVDLIPVDPNKFGPDSKAGKGGCSQPNCPDDAVEMNKQATATYCKEHADRVRYIPIPCPSTMTYICRPQFGQPDIKCPVCRDEER